jgi:hypothetical protein
MGQRVAVGGVSSVSVVLCCVFGCTVCAGVELIAASFVVSVAFLTLTWLAGLLKKQRKPSIRDETNVMRLFVKLLANFSGLASEDPWANHVRVNVDRQFHLRIQLTSHFQWVRL